MLQSYDHSSAREAIRDSQAHTHQLDDRRAHPRLKCKGQGELRIPSAGVKMAATIEDLSARGCCLECASHIGGKLPAQVEVHLRIGGIHVLLAGVLRRVQDGCRAGIEFTDIGPRKQEQIRFLMEELFEIDHRRKFSAKFGLDARA